MGRVVEVGKQHEPSPVGAGHGRAASPTAASRSPALELQQLVGNQAMQQLLRSGFIQAKLAISNPDDPEEREADDVSNTIMRKAAGTPAASPCSCSEGEEQCDECQQKQSTPVIQRRASSPAASPHIPAIMNDVLRSPGRPLDSVTRAFFEPRFGRDFSDVRIHTGADASASAQAIRAKAYTVGRNIVFSAGEFGPESLQGRGLLAHELVHVIQQRHVSTDLHRISLSAGGSDEQEREANLAAEIVPSGHSARITGSVSSARVQRAPDDIVLGNAAAGCGICYGVSNIKGIGFDAHQQIKQDFEIMYPNLMTEFPIELQSMTHIISKGVPDLVIPTKTGFKVGEIKPANPEGYINGEAKLQIYDNLLHLRYAGINPDLTVERMEETPPGPFPFIEPAAIACDRQIVFVNRSIRGVYGYYCYPPFSFELRSRCRCAGENQRQEDPGRKEPGQKQPDTDPSDTLEEKLLKLGEEAGLALAADGLLGVALELAGALAIALSPFLALASLVLAIVYFWDRLMWLGGKLLGLAKWVLRKIDWVGEEIAKLGIKFAQLMNWLAGKIEWIVDKVAQGIEWAAHKVVAGVKWVGGKIASAAKSAWHWLFGSDPEPEAPKIDLPVNEPTTHCATVAHDDTIVKIGADLLFAFNDSNLKQEADSPLLDAAAKIHFLLRDEDDRVYIDGYTDNVGGASYNQGLSERRAMAVAIWFVQHGVAPMPMIRTKGYGKTKAFSNDPEGRAKDRRVEIWVTKHGSLERVCR